MLKNIFTFSGRFNRKPYWMGFLLIMAVYVLIAIFFAIGTALALPEWAFLVGVVLAAVPVLLSVVFSISITIRRLHDRNKGWWWFAFYMVVPSVLQGIGEGIGTEEAASLPFTVIGLGISLWALIELGFFKGTPGYNDYGPDPLSGEMVDHQVFD